MTQVYRPLVFDIGCHVGQDTDYYLAKGCRVVAVDANPIMAANLRSRRSSAVDQGLLVVINQGIDGPPLGPGWSHGNTPPFYVNSAMPEWSSFNEALARRKAYPSQLMTVTTVSPQMTDLAALTEKFGTPHYIKIDIEGHDYKALQYLRGLHQIAHPTYLSVEVGGIHVVNFLVGMGYTHFKFINQAKVSEHVSTVTDGSQWKFLPGSSGAFGEDTPGPWLSCSEASKLVSDYWSIPDRNAAVHGWFDLHAKKG